MFAPLGDTPVDPDVVLFVAAAGKLMLLEEAAIRAGVASKLPLLARPTCMAIPAAMAHGMVTSAGCIGNRVYTDIGDDELYAAIPGRALEQVARGAGDRRVRQPGAGAISSRAPAAAFHACEWHAPRHGRIEVSMRIKIGCALLLAVSAVGAAAGACAGTRWWWRRSRWPPTLACACCKSGGNAIDAAVAIGFALAVTYPYAGNIGGGGFMLARFADGRTTFIDFREKAPLAATRNMYLDSKGNVTEDSLVGWRAAGVPGTVRGLELAHQKYGRKPWAELLNPAVQLASEGFPVSYSFDASLHGEERQQAAVAVSRIEADLPERALWRQTRAAGTGRDVEAHSGSRRERFLRRRNRAEAGCRDGGQWRVDHAGGSEGLPGGGKRAAARPLSRRRDHHRASAQRGRRRDCCRCLECWKARDTKRRARGRPLPSTMSPK